MCNFLSLSGLTLDIIGVGILVRDEITSMAATIKQHESTISGSWWQNAAYYLARKFGSKDSLSRESFIGDSFPRRLWGFVFLIVGFLFQALAVILQ
jgi:hypothetical protein